MTLKHTDAFVLDELEKKATWPMRLDYGNDVIRKNSEGLVFLKDVKALLGEREKELRSRLMSINESLKEEPYPWTNTNSVVLQAGAGLLKEILGEE